MRPIQTLTLILLLASAPLSAQTPAGAAPGSRRLPAPAPAVTQPAGLTLKEVREAYAKADADRSGGLSADEAAIGGVDAAAFAAADADSDSKLSVDEYTVVSEGRAAKLATGAAADLTAESTRVQALRRAQKSEDIKSKRELNAPPAPTPAAASAGARSAAPVAATPAPSGPAAARRALAPAIDDPNRTPEEVRADILRRVRNGEISADKARTELEAIDLRIAKTTGAKDPAAAGAPSATPGAAVGAAIVGKEPDLRAIEESLNRRLRNSELDPAKAKELYSDTLRRVENARGADGSKPAPGADGTSAAAGAAESSTEPAAPQGFRAKLADAQGDLTRRVRNAELTPEQAALEEAAMTKRLRQAAEGVKAAGGSGSATPAAPSASAAGSATAPTSAAGTETKGTGGTALNPAPARARTDAPAQPAPAAPVANPPARRGNDAAPAAPAAAPARGSAPTPAPSTQPPRPAPAGNGAGETKPAAPAAKPARPAGGGGR